MQNNILEVVNAPSSTQTAAMTFDEFLRRLLNALRVEEVHPCILRNYEGFPYANLANDIDFLIRPSELPRAIRAVRSIQGIRMVGYSERFSVAITYLEGVSPAPEQRALQVDFIMSLSWKGLPHLTTEAVLAAATPRKVADLEFLVPSPAHEAITSLLSSLLVAGQLKEKYLPQVQRTFAGDRTGTIAALSPQIGQEPAIRLVDSVIAGDRAKMLDCVPSLRTSLALRSILRNPIRSAVASIRHYTSEFAVRFSPKGLETVCIMGADAAAVRAVVAQLIPILQSTAKVVEGRPPRPRLPFRREPAGANLSGDSPLCAQGGPLASMARVFLWLLEEWWNQFTGKKNLTLRIYDGYYLDLFIDPTSYGCAVPSWFARLVSKLFPSPDLWILLDPAVGGSESAGKEDPSPETLRRVEAYRTFVKTQRNYVVLDANRPACEVIEAAYAAIIETFAENVDRKLKKRF